MIHRSRSRTFASPWGWKRLDSQTRFSRGTTRPERPVLEWPRVSCASHIRESGRFVSVVAAGPQPRAEPRHAILADPTSGAAISFLYGIGVDMEASEHVDGRAPLPSYPWGADPPRGAGTQMPDALIVDDDAN